MVLRDASYRPRCVPSTRVAGHKVNAQPTLAAYNGKYLVTWFEGSPSHLWGKWSDGAAAIDLGVGDQQAVVTTIDATGKEYLLYREGSQAGRMVFDLTTGQILKSSPTPFTALGAVYGIGALPTGALAIYNDTATILAIDENQNDNWDFDGGLDGGAYATASVEFSNVALNAAGKGAAWWVDLAGSGKQTMHVLAFDGTSLAAPVTRDFFVSDGHGASSYNAAALSNGDVVFTWSAFPAS